MVSGRWMKIGAWSWEPTTAAVSMPMAYWPSTPMLNRPALNAIAVASPARISGVARPKMKARESLFSTP